MQLNIVLLTVMKPFPYMFYMFPFQNNSNKAVKKIKVSVRQFADICLFSTAQYKCTVDEKVNSSASKSPKVRNHVESP